MSLVDVLVLVSAALAALAGWRLGFAARALAWVGLIVGLLVAVQVLDDVVAWLDDASPEVRVLVATAFVLGLAFLGQAIGLAAGTLLRRARPGPGPGPIDRGAGALAGVAGLLVLLWLLTPALSSAPGWPARAARASTVLDVLEQVAPDPPNSVEALSRLVAQAPFPEVFGDLRGPPEVGEAPTATVPADVDAVVRASSVQIVGRACDQIQEGSGFVADEDLVVTNAHVVAGESETEVVTQDGRRLFAEVAAFDPDRDLAALRVPGLDLPSLAIGEADVGAQGAVYGYPQGGPLRAAPARIAERIEALGTDIYRTGDTRRDVYVLAAELAPGDSGGALVDPAGTVVGVAFAIDPADAGTSYALTDEELRDGLRDVRNVDLDTGPCLVR